jgi:hypothetical protein
MYVFFKLFTKNLTAHGYCAILEQVLKPQLIKKLKNNYLIIQDNYLKHNSDKVYNFMVRNKFKWVNFISFDCFNLFYDQYFWSIIPSLFEEVCLLFLLLLLILISIYKASDASLQSRYKRDWKSLEWNENICA